MYRIHFDPMAGKFIIQVGWFGGLLWKTVHHDKAIDGPRPLQFDTYRNACLHVDTIGLSALYDDRSDNKRRKFMALA